MEFRHIFMRNRIADRIYMNILRPLGYLALLYPKEHIHLYHDKSKYTYLKKYKNCHQGEKCFIIGTGPSLKKEQLDAIKNEVLIGVNGLCLWESYKSYLNYFFIGDIHAYKKLYHDVPNNTFVSSFCINMYGNPAHRPFQEIPVCRFNYFVPYCPKISFDITRCFYDFNSVIFLALQFAIYAGFSEIYLLGVDCNYSSNKIYAVDHGIRHRAEYMRDVGKDMIHNFEAVQNIIKEKKLPVTIYNASDGGMLEVFHRKSLMNILSSKK